MEAYISWKPDGTDRAPWGKGRYGSLIFKHGDKDDITWVVWIAKVLQPPEQTIYPCRPEDIDWDSYYCIGPLKKNISNESISEMLYRAVPAGKALVLSSECWARKAIYTLYTDWYIGMVQFGDAINAI